MGSSCLFLCQKNWIGCHRHSVVTIWDEIRECVTEKKKVLNNVRSKEVDGDLLRAMEDDEMEEHIGLDGLMVKKLRKKMDGVARDEEAENKVAALITFLERIHLSQYHDRLVNDLGVADIKELPELVENADFLERLQLKFAEESRFKNAVRQIMHPSNNSTTLQPQGKLSRSAGGTPGGSATQNPRRTQG
mmetsp:Transcript_47083/g.94353  ORF Transcript_47083/g.94353 Transcript_47083/m.94353 type:complete len:190 (+) Transcript_47083:284-853(+)